MNKIEEKIELLRRLQEDLDSLSYPFHAEEKSVIRRVLGQEKWKLLSDDEKQSHRQVSISLAKKWGLDDNPEQANNISYAEEQLVVYDSIREILGKIDVLTETLNADLLRIKAFLLIEKDFIDETHDLQMERHLPREVFDNLLKSLEENYPDLQLNKFRASYGKMYEKWVNKPEPVRR